MRKFLYFIILFLFIFLANVKAQDNISTLQIKVDSLVFNAIDSAAFPGAQVLIMQGDKILVHKSYGHHTFERKIAVQNQHLYDLASVTKVMAGGLALMKMQEQGLFDPSQTISETHSGFENSNKSDITWQSVLAHQSRMKPYIIFWQTAMRKNMKFKWRTFSGRRDRFYNITIDNSLNLHRRYPSKIRKLIRDSELNEEEIYLYSGLGFLLIPELVYQQTGLPLDKYLSNEVYSKLEHSRITFKPAEKYPLREIVPTEIDTFFRNSLVHGYVHDENASMLGGVSANAGLFSNALSLGEIARELLSSENQIFKESIVKQYTSVQFRDNGNRRGLTFDKPVLDSSQGGSYIASSASPSSFGHSGFTGTFIWMDPEYDLTVVFLSNRVYPYRSSRKLYTMNFRPQLHQLAYDYVLKQEP
jgi:CubicO group peptidase (beta-lactamase class C family)